jgi:hypothetical protein
MNAVYDAIYNKHLANSTAKHGDPTLRFANSQPWANEMQLVDWVRAEARRLRISPRAMYVRLYRGKHPWPPTRRVNSRLIFVTVNQPKTNK